MLTHPYVPLSSWCSKRGKKNEREGKESFYYLSLITYFCTLCLRNDTVTSLSKDYLKPALIEALKNYLS